MKKLFLLLLLTSCARHRVKLPGDYPGCFSEPRLEKIGSVEVKEELTAFTSGEAGELLTCLPSIYPHTYIPLPLYGVRFTNLKRGDVLHLEVESEFTNDIDNDSSNFMVVAFFTIGFSPSHYGAQEIGDRNGYNITRAMHHGTFNKSATYTVPTDMPWAYLMVHAYTADGSTLEPEFLKVEQGYGRLSGLILRQKGIL